MIGELINNEAREINNPSSENFRNIKPESETTTDEVNNYWKSIFRGVADKLKNEKVDYYTSLEDRIKCTNLDATEGGMRGSWDGERGNSIFRPSYEYMKETLKRYGLEGIEYVNGEANFAPVAEETVIINNMSSERYGHGKNFDQANTKLANRFNEIEKDGVIDWTAKEIEEYRTSNGLTWHERCDRKTMDLVPTKIHDYFKHSGGVAEFKAKERIGERFDG